MQAFEEEVIDYLILGGYTVAEVAEEFDISASEVRAIIRRNEEDQ